MNNKITNLNKKGMSLYLAILVMAILLSIGLMISTILLGQIKMIKGMGDSVIAFYAADSGIEKALMNRQGPKSISVEDSIGELDNGAKYKITVMTPSPECMALNFCIQSLGSYKDTKRAIEVEY